LTRGLNFEDENKSSVLKLACFSEMPSTNDLPFRLISALESRHGMATMLLLLAANSIAFGPTGANGKLLRTIQIQ